MRYLLILILVLSMSCKSNTAVKTKSTENGNFLLSLSKEKSTEEAGKKITKYKDVPLKKVLDIEEGTFQLLFNDKAIFEGDKNCLFLLEIFNNETLLISTSNESTNKYVAGPENFKRSIIILIEKSTGEIRVANLQENILLKSYKGNLKKASDIKNQFAVKDISFSNEKMILENALGKQSNIIITKMQIQPLKCK